MTSVLGDGMQTVRGVGCSGLSWADPARREWGTHVTLSQKGGTTGISWLRPHVHSVHLFGTRGCQAPREAQQRGRTGACPTWKLLVLSGKWDTSPSSGMQECVRRDTLGPAEEGLAAGGPWGEGPGWGVCVDGRHKQAGKLLRPRNKGGLVHVLLGSPCKDWMGACARVGTSLLRSRCVRMGKVGARATLGWEMRSLGITPGLGTFQGF